MAKLKFGNVEETVVTREEFPLEKAREILKDETIAVIGYGVQGPGQSLNLRDNGFNVIVGQREGKTYEKAVADGWVPGETLFSIEEACAKGTIIMCLLSDAAVLSVWPTIKKHLTPGKALYFSHGFAIAWPDRTGVVPPKDVDVILVAPKGSGTSLRTMFLEGRGLNSSYAIEQDYTGKALDRTLALAIGIGSGYIFETTFKREAYSDLTGERGSLMGAIQGLLLAQYEVLRENGHTPSEAFNETVEELSRMYHLLKPLSVEERMKKYDLKPDRADVIIPASEIFLTVASLTGAKKIVVPVIGKCHTHAISYSLRTKQPKHSAEKNRRPSGCCRWGAP